MLWGEKDGSVSHLELAFSVSVGGRVYVYSTTEQMIK